MLPSAAYGPSLRSPSSLMTPSEASTNLLRTSGSAMTPLGGIQSAGRLDGFVSWANAAGLGASMTTRERERSAFLLNGVRSFFTTADTATVRPRAGLEVQ